MGEIKIESDAMQAIVSKAILEGIDDNQRNAIMEQAVAALIKPRGERGYGKPEPSTPLQEAFDAAVRRVVNEVTQEVVTGNTALREQVRALVVEAMSHALDNSSDLRERVASAVGGAVLHNWQRD